LHGESGTFERLPGFYLQIDGKGKNFIFYAQIKKILLAFLNFVIYSTGWMYPIFGIEPGGGFCRLLTHNF